MKKTKMHVEKLFLLSLIFLICTLKSFSQPNIRFDFGNFQNWEVKVGYKNKTNPSGPYIDEKIYPTNNNNTSFPEYSPTNIVGIKLVSLKKAPITDRNFDVFPDFNQQLDTSLFDYVVKIGSATVTEPLPLARKLTYNFDVTSTNNSFTYAYAILLEDGTHETDQQPKFTAKVFLNNSQEDCLSYEYQLPTNNGVIDQQRATDEGFRKSNLPSETDKRTQRVWVRDWREMFLDLSSYIGKTVRIELEASNCIPAGHYAYAYVAISKNFGDPFITATKNLCPGKKIALKVPNIKYASYEWKVIQHTSDFVFNNTTFNKYKLELDINPNPTNYVDQEVAVTIKSKCFADKELSYKFDISKKAVGGTLTGPTFNLCEGSNTNLNLTGYTGTKYVFQKSINKINWTDISPPSDINASILTPSLFDSITYFRIKIYNNLACPLDSSSIAVVKTDAKSIPGNFVIPSTVFCKGQTQNTTLKLKDYSSNIDSWEYTIDNGSTWNMINNTSDVFDLSALINSLTPTPNLIALKTNISNGVCDTTTKEINITYNASPFPGTTAYYTKICYGDTVKLVPKSNPLNLPGATYTWNNYDDLLIDPNDDKNALVFPKTTNDYVLKIKNQGCPNSLLDTFTVAVFSQMKIDLQNDKGIKLEDPSTQDIVLGETYLYDASAYNTDNSSSTFNYDWKIIDPFGFYTLSQFAANNNIVKFTPDKLKDLTSLNIVNIKLTAINQATGCLVTRDIIARIFNGPPQFFVPTAFTPNGDHLNDTFKPYIPGVILKSFRIFNRFGKIVFETSDSNAAWDGTVNGVPQNAGTYVWQAFGTGRDGSAIKPQKGTVTLIR